jgi:hypothetical protein
VNRAPIQREVAHSSRVFSRKSHFGNWANFRNALFLKCTTVGFLTPYQERSSIQSVQSQFDKQIVSECWKLGVMVKVFACGLYRVHYVFS